MNENYDVNHQEYKKDNDINLSDLEDDQRKELLDLEHKIDNKDLSRGERRRLQNRRNVLKAKFKKELHMESHITKITKL